MDGANESHINGAKRKEEHRLDIRFEDEEKSQVRQRQDDSVGASNRSRPLIKGDLANVHSTKSSESVCSVCIQEKKQYNLD